LHGNIEVMSTSISVPAQSAIFPIILGDGELAVQASRKLAEAGFLVPAIRYPTVARGSERLRITVTAAHESGAIERLGSHLSDLVVQKSEIDEPRVDRA
jgi:8-amino-7-oxononanoate synthase